MTRSSRETMEALTARKRAELKVAFVAGWKKALYDLSEGDEDKIEEAWQRWLDEQDG